MAGEYRVVGPAAVVRVAGRRVSVERGGVVPEGADAEHLAHLVSVGLVSEVEVADEPEATVDLESMTVEQLREYAQEHEIDLQNATKKADLLLAILAATA